MKWLSEDIYIFVAMSELRAYVEQLPQQVKSCYAGQADYGQWYQRPNRKDQCVQLSHTHYVNTVLFSLTSMDEAFDLSSVRRTLQRGLK